MAIRHPETPAVRRYPARVYLSLFFTALITSLMLISGCGSDDGVKTIATVGDYEIKSDYYEFMLSKLGSGDLPTDQNGLPIDTSTEEGKLAFLQILINKELMAQKAEELGFGKDENVNNATAVVSEYEAGKLMHKELVEDPCSDISDQQVQDYYDKMGMVRNFQFMICNFEDDARKARDKVVAGELWEDVADEFNDGSRGPKGDYTVSIKYGQVEDYFEEAIYGLNEGEVTQPVPSVYGWWVLRFNNLTTERVPPLEDELKERIRATLVSRCINLSREEFIQASCKKHELNFDETALWIIFQGMPEEEPYMDDKTQQPIDKNFLKKLDVPTSELDKVLYSCRFDLDAEPEVWTIGDYKDLYDSMNVFQRPKRSDMLGGVRKKFMEDMIYRQLLIAESKERNFDKRTEVTSVAKQRSEQVMVTKLHEEIVKFDEVITPEQLNAFWEDHKQDYNAPARRSGRIAYCKDKDLAAKAREDALAGGDWTEIMNQYEQTRENKKTGGKVSFASTDVGADRDAMFMLEKIGDVSAPVPSHGFWAIALYEEDLPEGIMDLDEVRDSLTNRIKSIRKDQALKDLLEKWRGEFGSEIHTRNLKGLKSWEQLKDTAAE